LALGLFGVAAPSHALDFNRAETKAFCLAETIVSLFAVLADHNGECPSSPGISGSVALDGVAGTASVTTPGSSLDLRTRLIVHPIRGAFCDTDADGALGGFEVSDYNGYLPRKGDGAVTHAWNRDRTIFTSGATVIFAGIDFYDEHNIKNFFADREIPGLFFDDGLEVITKFGYPRAKWRQKSEYRRPDGSDGRLSVVKYQVTPAPAEDCTIDLRLDVDNAGGSFVGFGSVSLSTPAAPPPPPPVEPPPPPPTP